MEVSLPQELLANLLISETTEKGYRQTRAKEEYVQTLGRLTDRWPVVVYCLIVVADGLYWPRITALGTIDSEIPAATALPTATEVSVIPKPGQSKSGSLC